MHYPSARRSNGMRPFDYGIIKYNYVNGDLKGRHFRFPYVRTAAYEYARWCRTGMPPGTLGYGPTTPHHRRETFEYHCFFERIFFSSRLKCTQIYSNILNSNQHWVYLSIFEYIWVYLSIFESAPSIFGHYYSITWTVAIEVQGALITINKIQLRKWWFS